MASTTTAAAVPAAAGAGGRSARSVNTLPLVAPSVVVLFLWMIVPLAMTLWFSFQYYNLLDPTTTGFAGFENYTYLLTDPSLWTAMLNTLYLVFWVLVITVGGGTLLAVHWRHPVADYPLPGDVVHAELDRDQRLAATVRHEETDFLLTVYARVPPEPRSVAEETGLA